MLKDNEKTSGKNLENPMLKDNEKALEENLNYKVFGTHFMHREALGCLSRC